MDLIINTYGTRIRNTSERLVISVPKTKEKKEYPIRKIKKILILVSSSISSDAVQLALEHDVDIVFMNKHGKTVGRVFPSTPKGLSAARRAQLEFSTSSSEIGLARIIVLGKAENQIRYLEYLGKHYSTDLSDFTIPATESLQKLQTTPVRTKEELMGTEGFIAERYFSAMKTLGDFPGRNSKSRDPWNTCLNYGYGILYNEVERACQYVGLDPHLGFYHSERYGKPSLVLDLVEEFRVGIVDSVLIPMLIDKAFDKRRSFKKDGEQFLLTQHGKKQILEAVYSRLIEKALYQGKSQKVESIIQLQVRMLARFFTDLELKYIPFSIDALTFLCHE